MGLPSADFSKCLRSGRLDSAGDLEPASRAVEAASASMSSDCMWFELKAYRGYSVQEYCGSRWERSGELVGRDEGDTTPLT